jgi:L-amino acid N-acyltransferase YncA
MALTDIRARRPKKPDADGMAKGLATVSETPPDCNRFSASFMGGRGLALIAEDIDVRAAWRGIRPIATRPVYEGVGEVSIYVS